MQLKALLALPVFALSVRALVSAVDSSTLVSVATFQRALSEGFTKAIPRGYQEACGVGGQVDPNFVPTYNNARAAGYTDIDTYFFPCSGSGNPCKAYSTQIAELGSTFNAHAMKIGTIWVDLEADTTVCHNWNYGAGGNQAQARSLINAFIASGYNFGVYSSPGEWSAIFGSQGFVLVTGVPLWYATYNNVASLAFPSPFGGWSSVAGHQYTDVSASGQFDLSVFAH